MLPQVTYSSKMDKFLLLITLVFFSMLFTIQGRLQSSRNITSMQPVRRLLSDEQPYSHRKLRTPKSNFIHIMENSYLIKLRRIESDGMKDTMFNVTDRILSKCSRVQLLFIYNLSINAIAITNVSYDDLTTILEDDDVSYAERDVVVEAFSVESDLDVGRWGLDRIDQQECVSCDDKDSHHSEKNSRSSSIHSYRYDLTGEGVQVFIIDSGILSTHKEFMTTNRNDETLSRVTCGRNFRDDLNETCEDEWGHGTHVASIVGGNSLGVAKNVTLVAVKVFGADGTSRYANIIAAIEFVMKRKRQNPNQPMVINLSLGTAQVAELLNEAVNEAVASGIPVVVAAGNSGQDACLFSPSSADLAITVGASTKEDNMYSNSNWGACVDIYAPGAEIRGAWVGKTNNEDKVLSGTSMAAPFVSGAISLYLQQDYLADPIEIRKQLFSDASVGVLNVEKGSTYRSKVSSDSLFLNIQSLLPPSPSPSLSPSTKPTTSPSAIPSLCPSDVPTFAPSFTPSLRPSKAPVSSPSYAPSTVPTVFDFPSESPTKTLSLLPTSTPTTEEQKELTALMQYLEQWNKDHIEQP